MRFCFAKIIASDVEVGTRSANVRIRVAGLDKIVHALHKSTILDLAILSGTMLDLNISLMDALLLTKEFLSDNLLEIR